MSGRSVEVSAVAAPEIRIEVVRRAACRIAAGGCGSIALFAAFVIIYACSIDLSAANVFWHNFVFDADIDRVTADAAHGQNVVAFGRHPLFALTLAWPASLLVRAGLGLPAALRLVVAAIAAWGVTAARVVFRRITGEDWLALVFSIAYGLSATTWLLASVPETFAVNASIVATCFFLQDPRFAHPLRCPLRFGAFVLLSVFAIGVTVSNTVYVVLGYLANVRRADLSRSHRAFSVAAYSASVWVLFVALSIGQKSWLKEQIVHPTGIVSPLGAAANDGYLDFHRPFVAREVLRLLRAFLLDNVVAPGTVVQVVDTVAGPEQMIQFGDWTRASYLFALGTVGVLFTAAALQGSLVRVAKSHLAQLAMVYVGCNLVLHYFYRANGQPFIFTIHAVLPLLVLGAGVVSASTLPGRGWLLTAAAAAIAGNNLTFVASVRDALAEPCTRRLKDICLSWTAQSPGPRYTLGLDGYLASAQYWGDRGDEALERGRAEDAVRFYSQALDRDANMLWAERNLGIALLQLGRLDEAAVHLGRVVGRAPDDEVDLRVLDEIRARRP
jgi:hypothetical protein